MRWQRRIFRSLVRLGKNFVFVILRIHSKTIEKKRSSIAFVNFLIYPFTLANEKNLHHTIHLKKPFGHACSKYVPRNVKRDIGLHPSNPCSIGNHLFKLFHIHSLIFDFHRLDIAPQPRRHMQMFVFLQNLHSPNAFSAPIRPKSKIFRFRTRRNPCWEFPLS